MDDIVYVDKNDKRKHATLFLRYLKFGVKPRHGKKHMSFFRGSKARNESYNDDRKNQSRPTHTDCDKLGLFSEPYR